MSGTPTEVYSIKNKDGFQTIVLTSAIKRAKEIAVASREKQTILLNHNPYASVDRRGNFIAA